MKGHIFGFFMAAILAVSCLAVPAKTVAAEKEAVVTFVDQDTTERGSVEKNPYGDDYIVDKTLVNDEARAAVLSRSDLELDVEVTVEEFTCTNGVPQFVVYAMDAEYTGSSWKQKTEDIVDQGSTFHVNLDLSGYTALGGLGSLGFRFVGCDDGTEVVYTIHHARLVAAGEQELEEGVIAVLEEGGSAKTKIVAENPYSAGEYLIKHMFPLPSPLSRGGLDGFEDLQLAVSVTVSEYTPSPSGATALLYAMDGTYGNWEQTEVKLTQVPQTMELTLDLATYIRQGTLGEFGFEVVGAVDGTKVVYTIHSAKVLGTGEANVHETTVDLRYPLTGEGKELSWEETPVGKSGKLKVAEVAGLPAPTTVDAGGNPVQLRGASSHGLSWFPGYVNKQAYQNLRDEWGMNMVRISVYAREGRYGYICDEAGITDPKAQEYNDKIIQEGVEAAKELGLYVIIDWHVLNYNPNRDLAEAKAFFEKYATLYKDYDNVLFEICNEPTGTPWYDGSDNDLFHYCSEVTQVIRDCGSDAIVICGTNSYSQEVDQVSVHPLSMAGFDNVMYTCHFYAASHYDDLQQRMITALEAGTPVMVTEYGICTASGDGIYDLENADKWLDICDAYNVSYACWAMSNSTESAAYFKSNCLKVSGWVEEDLTVTGKYLINRYNDRLLELEEEPVTDSVVDLFSDIKEGDWWVKAVQYVYDNGIMTGKGEVFEPTAALQREEFVQMLYNVAGKPELQGTAPDYRDVKENAWFRKAVLWANETGIAKGTGDGRFGVGDRISRQDLALMLYRYAQENGYDMTVTNGACDEFADSAKIKIYAKNALEWAVTQGIMSGKGANLDPAGNATRAECAAMMMRLLQQER